GAGSDRACRAYGERGTVLGGVRSVQPSESSADARPAQPYWRCSRSTGQSRRVVASQVVPRHGNLDGPLQRQPSALGW
nr:hypothetical protein [Tanacetum cinerariifolium]